MTNIPTAIIVDDEDAPRNDLASRLRLHFPNLHIAAECHSAEEATLAIARHAPNLVFLDVEMPGMNGFEFLESLKEIRFSVIFTTSHAAHAVRAFRVAAVDFLLKPFSTEDLQAAVNRFMQHIEGHQNKHLDVLLKNLTGSENTKIALPTSSGYLFADVREIIRLESQNTYTTFFMKDKNQIVVSRTMKDCEEMMVEYGFIRVHQSHMINLTHIKKFTRGEGGIAEMIDGSTVEISRRKKEEFLEALKRL
jgi:two-component system LytT family response regulator